jgi:predicted polyphosphate/ATP-dependent NAD kinase
MPLRQRFLAGRTNQEILSMVSQHIDADDVWEKAQRDKIGHVYAPAATVKARIRQLVLMSDPRLRH